MKTKKRRDVISAFKEANRSIELERNGGRWIAKDCPHKNKKKYCRKDSKKELSRIIDGSSFCFISLFLLTSPFLKSKRSVFLRCAKIVQTN